MSAKCLNRLRFVEASVQHIQAELSRKEELVTLLQANVPDSWPPGQFDRDALNYFNGLLQENAVKYAGWLVWYGIEISESSARDKLAVVAGYFGPPEDGQVEIGYSVAPEFEGRGYAQQITRFLVARAFESPLVTKVNAKTSINNTRSINVLLKSGFTLVHRDEENAEARFSCQKRLQ